MKDESGGCDLDCFLKLNVSDQLGRTLISVFIALQHLYIRRSHIHRRYDARRICFFAGYYLHPSTISFYLECIDDVMNSNAARIFILLTTTLFFNTTCARANDVEKFSLVKNKENMQFFRSEHLIAAVNFFGEKKFDRVNWGKIEGRPMASPSQNTKPKEKKAKLSPEERRALRQQVRDVEQELHPPKK
ncbi:hypothetical protein ACO0K0_19620 [Undibacterium sp. SXout11W]|uniref:hypothetical protein n=1 Tax=Undibacterium sp. SXout11W TaxID=3413050 RepID=UPI003BF00BCF